MKKIMKKAVFSLYYVKYMPGISIKNASRNKRELSAAHEFGFRTVVFSGDKPGSVRTPEFIDRQVWEGTEALDETIPKWKFWFRAWRNRFILFYRTMRLPIGVWSCHDLSALSVAYRVTRFRIRKPILIYDSHEFEMGRNVRRTKEEAEEIKRKERFYIDRCAFTIVVNDSIADEVQRIHELKQRPVVVRNTPDNWKIDESVCADRRAAFMDEFRQKGSEVSFLAMYHGGMMRNRGIEPLIKAAAKTEGIGLVLLGSGEENYVAAIRRLIGDYGMADRVLFYPLVPLEELWKYLGAVDVGVMPIETVVKNHYYSLPNKFFESIQSLTPIIASDIPEMRRLVDKYQIGLTCRPGDPEDISRCIAQLRDDPLFYARCKENLKRAKEELCWEKEKQVLLKAYRDHFGELKN